MENLKFKTTIKCGGCISTVTPFLDNLDGIENWQVDLENPDKILEINGTNLNEQTIIETLKTAGYTAELVEA